MDLFTVRFAGEFSDFDLLYIDVFPTGYQMLDLDNANQQMAFIERVVVLLGRTLHPTNEPSMSRNGAVLTVYLQRTGPKTEWLD